MTVDRAGLVEVPFSIVISSAVVVALSIGVALPNNADLGNSKSSIVLIFGAH